MTTFFSIIIPTLNEELFLPRILTDLKKQKSKNFEIIIVDAKSTDKTKKIANSYKSKLRLRVLISNKKNVSYQKNFGAQKAKGSYLIFLDADCKLNKTFTQKFEKNIIQKKGLVFFPYISPEDNTPQTKKLYQFLNFMIDRSQILKNPFSSVGCMCLERNFFNLIGGFDEKIKFQEDLEIAKKSRLWGVIGTHLPDVKFIFSFRKIKKEGNLKSLYKLIIGNAYYVLNKNLNKSFSHEMGGHIYDKDPLRKNKIKLTRIELTKIKKYFKNEILDTKS
ncbi:MAG: glycosyltransferase [Patescibacteria group bacterium]